MTTSSRVFPPSESRSGEKRNPRLRGGPGGVITTVLLAIVLMAAPLVLGSARQWYELPLLVVVALLLVVQGVRLSGKPARSEFRKVDAIDWAVVLFTLYAIVRWLTSPVEYFSRFEAFNVVAYAVIFLTCRHGLPRRTYGVVLVELLVVLGVGEAIFGYLFSLHSDVFEPESLWFPFGTTERLQLNYAPRWLGTYGCPDHYASLLVMAIGAALALGSFSKLAWPMRIVLFYVAALMGVALLYSGSRGGWLSFLASIIALTIFGLRHGTVRWWVPVMASLLLLSLVGYTFNKSHMARDRIADAVGAFQNGTLNTYVRVELAEDALRIAQDHPVFGTGPATFTFIHPRYQSSTFGRKAVLTHDDYLNCLDDYGVVGFGIAMFFVIAVSFKFLRSRLAEERWQDRVLVATGFAAWSALLLHSTVDFNLHIPANAMMLFALAGMGLSRLRDEEGARNWSTLSLAPLGLWLGVPLIVLGLAYGLFVARTAISDILYEHYYAGMLTVPTMESINGAKEALRYDPTNAQAMAMVGDLYRYRASREQEIEGRVLEGQQALDAYRFAIKANPLDDSLQARMGLTFDVMRRYAEAFFCYKAAVTNQRYDGQFWNALGNHYWQRGLLQKAEQAYLLAAKCPHGFEGSAEAADELRALLSARGIPPPEPGTNPLESAPEEENAEPATEP